MDYRVRFTLSARKDAQGYARFIRDTHKSPPAAKKWLEGLLAAILEIADGPMQFSLIPESEELGADFRSVNYHSHRVIYAVHEKDHTILIHRIYAGAFRPLTAEDL